MIAPRLLVISAIGMAYACRGQTILSDWTSFDDWVSSNRHCSHFAAPLYPPGMTQVGEYLGIIVFDESELPVLSELPCEPVLSIDARRIRLVETMDEPRRWLVLDATNAVVREISPPPSYATESWIQTGFGQPPPWLSGDALSSWWTDRDPSRIMPSALLVNESAWTNYVAALGVCIHGTTNGVSHETIVLPSDTNRIAFAAFSMGSGPEPTGWLYSPWPERDTTVFRKEFLDDPLWTPVVGFVPGDALAPWTDEANGDALSPEPPLRSTMPAATGFYAAAEVQTDSDGDGIPDGMELLAHGSSPYLADSDGDGLSDALEILRYGTDPGNADTNDDSIPDGTAVSLLLDPTALDSDGDGLSDADEILVYATKPDDSDSDNDGLSDYEEVILHGSSPFHSDTDGDGLSDFREVRELGSSPCSCDSDGDGMDDAFESLHLSRGLDPSDPSDGGEDYDDDGFPNAEEAAWGWSHFLVASSNETAAARMHIIQPGKSPIMKTPSVTQSTISATALGRNGSRGLRIRIPKCVQLGTNTATRTLCWTAAPGVFIGDTELASAGSMPIPDEDVELPVWAAPSAAGTNAYIRLVKNGTSTNGAAHVSVPRLRRAKLYLSNLSSSSAATNLAPGVVGTVCTAADDPLFGKPRATIDPLVDPDGYGMDMMRNAGFILARISGATPEETKPVDSRLWNGAYRWRHGFELEPGISRINVGLDFDLDGELDASEITHSCDVHVVPVRLSVDTDRNGAVDAADREGCDRWEPQRGALLAVDAAATDVAAFRPPQESSLARLVVEKTGIPLPDGWFFSLSLNPSGYIVLYDDDGNRIPHGDSTTNGFQNIASDDAVFRIASNTSGHQITNPTKIQLRLRRNFGTCATDEVSLRPAPLVVPWNTLPLKRLYTAGIDGGLRFPPEIEPAKQHCIPVSALGGHWVQDMVQMSAFQLSDLGFSPPVSIDLGHDRAGTFATSLPANVGVNAGAFLCYLKQSNNGNGGNVEATPPLPGYPFGRLLTGVGDDGHVCNAVALLEKQGLQGPAITVPVDWLAVGHVDEVCCFLNANTVMVPSPRLAFDLIAEQVVLHGGNYTNTFVWGIEPTDYIHRMQDVLFDYVVPSNWTLSDVSATDTSFDTTYAGFHRGDKLLCGTEVMEVSGIYNDTDGFLVTLLRGQHGTEAASHSTQDPLLCLSSVGFANGFDDTVKAPLPRINEIKSRLRHAIPDLSFIDIPVLFMSSGIKYVAGSANMVNAVVAGGTVYMTDPGCDLFQNAVPVSGATFVGGTNAWQLYHCRMGELHCGSEAERWLPASPPFWKRPEFKAWPFEKKGTTP